MEEKEEKSRCDQVSFVSGGVRGYVTTYLQHNTPTHARYTLYTHALYTICTPLYTCVSLFCPVPSPFLLLRSFSFSHHVVGDEDHADHNAEEEDEVGGELTEGVPLGSDRERSNRRWREIEVERDGGKERAGGRERDGEREKDR